MSRFPVSIAAAVPVPAPMAAPAPAPPLMKRISHVALLPSLWLVVLVLRIVSGSAFLLACPTTPHKNPQVPASQMSY